MPLAVCGHENKQVKLFDLNSSKALSMQCLVKLIKAAIAHTDAVTSLIARDFTLMTGGHDGSIRVWDIRKMQLLYEVPVRLLSLTNSVGP